MSKILKNNTGSAVEVEDIGITVPASGQYVIPAQDYLLVAASDDIIVVIGDETLTVNDGSIDLSISEGIDLLKGFLPKKLGMLAGDASTEIGHVGDRLKVEAQVTVANDAAPGCPVISPKLRIEFDETNITVPSAYTTMYNYNGAGKLYGFTLDFNSDSVRVRLVIDGTETIFALTLDEVESIQSFSSGGCNDGGVQNINFVTKTSGNRFNFTPPCPVEYTSSVLIEAQRSGSSNKTQSRQIVYLTKES